MQVTPGEMAPLESAASFWSSSVPRSPAGKTGHVFFENNEKTNNTL